MALSTWNRYLLFQIPSWLMVVITALALWQWQLISPELSALGLIGWIAKDLLMYPYLRSAYEIDNRSGTALLFGSTAVAVTRLNPNGQVRVRGEVWRAVVEENAAPIEAGSRVEIVDAHGLQLVVRLVTNA